MSAATLRELLSGSVQDVERTVRLCVPAGFGSKDSVHDLTQSVLGDVLPRLDRLECPDEGAFRAYLCECARNKVRMRIRHWNAQRRNRDREHALHDLGPDPFAVTQTTPSEAAGRAEAYEATLRAMERLPEMQREAVMLVKVLGLSHEECAAALGISRDNSKQLVKRGLAKLSGLLPDL